MSIVTDSKEQDESKDFDSCNIVSLHKLFSRNQLEELKERYKEGKISYKESKEILAENINLFLDPIREKKAELDKNEEYVLKVLKEGKEKVLPIAEKKLQEVRKKIGIDL
jgi:tryptophanyl-tRNA synthetase